MTWLDGLNEGLLYWHWLSLGLMLVAFEMFAPGASMLWMGAAAIVTGVITWLFPGIPWQQQVICFGLLGIAAVVLSRRYFRRDREMVDEPLNRRAEQLVGRVVALEAAIEGGTGRIRVGDGSWTVTGPDLPVGAKVRIIAADGAVLAVEQAV